MDRRTFLKNSTIIAGAGILSPEILAQTTDSSQNEKLIVSPPMLQNFAKTSMGIAFQVSDMANGYVTFSENPDMTDSKTVKCGGYRVTDMNEHVIKVRLINLKPSTKYYYTIGADRIEYKGGYNMKVTQTENDPKIYSFTTAGDISETHFCVINDTHAKWETFDKLQDKILSIKPKCVVWNGDATNCQETIESLKEIFLTPPISNSGYASEIPYLFCPGNHDLRGLASRHLENVWMFRQPEERLSRDWDLGRNFAVRLGDTALIGLDTGEDKVDDNPNLAGLFNSEQYRIAQTEWLINALARKDISNAPYLVAFCHIPLIDTNPADNPGDVHPNDTDPKYSSNYAFWQRDCANMWLPLLEKAGCQLLITAHMHQFRIDHPDELHKITQIVGGGPSIDNATMIEGKMEDGKLAILVHNLKDDNLSEKLIFERKQK